MRIYIIGNDGITLCRAPPDLGTRIPARDRFAPDSPLEESGFEISVPPEIPSSAAAFHVSWRLRRSAEDGVRWRDRWFDSGSLQRTVRLS